MSDISTEKVFAWSAVERVILLGRSMKIIKSGRESEERFKVQVRVVQNLRLIEELSRFSGRSLSRIFSLGTFRNYNLYVSIINNGKNHSYEEPSLNNGLKIKILKELLIDCLTSCGPGLVHCNDSVTSETDTYIVLDWERVSNLLLQNLRDPKRLAHLIVPSGCDLQFVAICKASGTSADQRKHFIAGNPLAAELKFVEVSCTAKYAGYYLFFNSSAKEKLPPGHVNETYPGIINGTGAYNWYPIPSLRQGVISALLTSSLFENPIETKCGLLGSFSVALRILDGVKKKLLKTLAGKKDAAPISEKLLGEICDLSLELRARIENSDSCCSRIKMIWSSPDCGGGCEDLLKEARTGAIAFVHETGLDRGTTRTMVSQKGLEEVMREVSKTLFNTLRSGIEKFNQLQQSSNILRSVSLELSSSDVAAVFVAEALITRIFQGSFCFFPAHLETELDFPQVPDGILNAWPFKKHLIWKDMATNTLRTSIPLENLIQELTDPVSCGLDIYNLFSCYALAHGKQSCTSTFITSLLNDAIVKSLLMRLASENGVREFKETKCLLALYQAGATGMQTSHVLRVDSSSNALDKLMQKTTRRDYTELTPLGNILEFLRIDSPAYEGFLNAYTLACSLNDFLLQEETPLIFLLPKNLECTVFVPTNVSEQNDQLLRTYERTFFACFRRNTGRRNIPVVNFLRVLLEVLCSIQKPPCCLNTAFGFINDQLDSGNCNVKITHSDCWLTSLASKLKSTATCMFSVPRFPAPRAKKLKSITSWSASTKSIPRSRVPSVRTFTKRRRSTRILNQALKVMDTSLSE